MTADDILNQLEAMLQDITPNQKARLQNVLATPKQPSTDKNTNQSAAPVEPKPGSPEYFATKREKAATAAQSGMVSKSTSNAGASAFDQMAKQLTPNEPEPQKFGSRGIPGLGENKFYSKFLNKDI